MAATLRSVLVVAASLLPLATAFGGEASSPQPRPKNGGADLTLVLVAAANFYCDKQRWPTSIDEVLQYRSEAKIRMEVEISEQWLRSSQVRIIAGASFRVRARDYLKEEIVIVVATQAMPRCENGEATTVEADMHLEPDGPL